MKINFKWLLAGLVIPSLALAAAFPLFQPANGILKGSTSTYVTTAATSADVIALWSGTCNNLRFLRGDGSCQLVDLGANVTGRLPFANLTQGSGLSVLGVTGNVTADFASIVAGADGNVLRRSGTTLGFGTITLSNTNTVTGVLGVANGGTNLSAALDDNVMLGNGTTWESKAVPNCTDTTGNHLNYTASTNTISCGTSAPGGFTGFANPTASVGLTAVNGSAVTAMRSDGAPALSQAIAPTWTATHIFNNSNSQLVLQNTSAATDAKNTLLRVTTAGAWAVSASSDAAPGTAVRDLFAATRSGQAWTNLSIGNATDNPSFTFLGSGTSSFAGMVSLSASNSQLVLTNAAAAADQKNTLIRVNTTGPFVISSSTDASPGAAVKDVFAATKTGTAWTSVAIGNSTDNPTFSVNGIALTPLTGSFVATFDDACTTSPTITFTYQKVGTAVTMVTTASSGFGCTGDSTNFATTGTPVPAGIRPTNTAVPAAIAPDFIDNGASTGARITITSAGNVTFTKVTGGTTSATWTAAGTRNYYGNGYTTMYMTNN